MSIAVVSQSRRRTFVEELGLSSVQMGFVFSAFAWAYSPFQISRSYLVDKIAPRVLYPIVIRIWSVFTCLQGIAMTVWQLVLYRLGVGASKVPSYPMNNRIITTWLPERERATAVGVYISGQLSVWLSWHRCWSGYRRHSAGVLCST